MSVQVRQSNARAGCIAVDQGIDHRGRRSSALPTATPQQITSLSIALAAILLGGTVVAVGASIGLGLIAAFLVPLSFHGIPLAIELAFGALADPRPVERLGLGDVLQVWLSETWTAFTACTIDQAWRANFAEPVIRRDAARPAVLFVHGYLCNRGVWKAWIERCQQVDRWNVATLNLEPALASIDSYTAQLDAAIARLRATSGADRVTLVCHSMGGLVARAYLRRYGDRAVRRVITINTPHHGTVFANCDRSANARQMRRSCDFLRKLAENAEPVEFICFASHHDNLIVPRDSQVLDCAEAIWFERIGHLAMTGDDRVFACLSEVVERPPVEGGQNAVRALGDLRSSSRPVNWDHIEGNRAGRVGPSAGTPFARKPKRQL